MDFGEVIVLEKPKYMIYDLRSLKVGDSFFIPIEEADDSIFYKEAFRRKKLIKQNLAWLKSVHNEKIKLEYKTIASNKFGVEVCRIS